jgi:hypothetical protein
MAKTNEISVNCTDVQVLPNGNRMVTATLQEPDVDDILDSIDDYDLIDWVKRNKNPDDLFSETELIQWAESEGYIKQNENQ